MLEKKTKKLMKKRIFTIIFICLIFVIGATGPLYIKNINAQNIGPTVNLAQSAAGSVGTAVVDYVSDSVVKPFVSGIASIALKVMAWLVGVAGLLLNAALKYTIVDMKENINGVTAINTAWVTIRDVANMAFIFILLYASIKTILGDGEKLRGLIVGMIIAALLINFSLFFTKIIIDASNVVATGFYSAIAPEGTGDTYLTDGISKSFTAPLQLQSLYNAADSSGIDYSQIITLGFMGSVFMLVVAFVFFAMTAMLIIRYVVLIILLVLSPLAFVGGIMPSLKSNTDKWWSALWGQTMFAPVFLLMAWVVVSIINDPTFLKFGSLQSVTTTNDGFSGLVSTTVNGGVPTTGAVGLFMNFVIAIVLMVASLIISKELSAKAGGVVSKATGFVQNAIGGATLGTAAWAGRRSLGSVSRNVADSEWLKEKASKSGVGGMTSRLALKASQKGAASSFDIRASKVGGAAADQVGGLGKFKKGGYSEKKEERKKKDDARLDDIVKRYSEKREWAGLSNVVKTKSQKEQEYIYKKLSEKDRVSLEGALADPTLTTRLRSKLPIDDQIKAHTNSKNSTKWNELATFLRAKTPDEQEYIYEKLSSRDRVELDKTLADPLLTTRLRSTLSIEEKDKTNKTEKEELKKLADKERFTNIDNLVAGRPTVPPGKTFDDLLGPGAKFSNKEARNLSLASLNNPEVIKRLSSRHLSDIIANHDEIDEPTKKFIRDFIILSPTGSYPLHNEQLNYLSSNRGVEAAWGV